MYISESNPQTGKFVFNSYIVIIILCPSQFHTIHEGNVCSKHNNAILYRLLAIKYKCINAYDTVENSCALPSRPATETYNNFIENDKYT